MKITEDVNGKYLRVFSEGDVDVSNLLGYGKTKGSSLLRVENNLVNRIVLGLPLDPIPEVSLVYGANLKPFQRADTVKMVGLRHVLNANPMGLGKTVEAIVAMRELNLCNVLVVTPKSVMAQWVDQMGKWWPERLKDTKVLPRTIGHGNIVIMNYDKLKNKDLSAEVNSMHWDLVVLDEAHRIKNRKSDRTLRAMQLKAERRWALTGTPILNRPDDLWSILRFLNEKYSGVSYWNFVEYFCQIEEGFWGRKIVGLTTDPARVVVLNKLLEYVCIRNPQNVAQGKTPVVVKVSMTPKQRTLYKKVKALVLDELPENLTVANGMVLTMRLQQLTSWPGLFEDSSPGGKFEWIREKLEDQSEESFVVFTRFAKVAEGLRKYLVGSGVTCSVYTGEMTPADRASAQRKFESGESRVLIGTIGALGTGVDGLQSVCSTMIMLDRVWSPEDMRQAEDRLHRMGQADHVTIYYLECEKSFDQYIGRINMNKLADVRRALNDD